MDATSSFHKLWVIESLRLDDLKTGTHLVEGALTDAVRKHPHLSVQHQTPRSKQELLGVLETIRDEAATQGIYPLLHIDCHGCPEGLETSDGTLVTWTELRIVLIEINLACRCNLLIVLAACNGAHLIKAATTLDRAPFWAIIAPDKEVTAGAIEQDFRAFYEQLFEGLSGDAAMAALNRTTPDPKRRYHFIGAGGLFVKAYVRYFAQHCMGGGKKRRIEELLTRSLDNPVVRNRFGVSHTRRLIKTALSEEERYFNKKRDQFFFVDRFPENAARFSLSQQDVLALIDTSAPKTRRTHP